MAGGESRASTRSPGFHAVAVLVLMIATEPREHGRTVWGYPQFKTGRRTSDQRERVLRRCGSTDLAGGPTALRLSRLCGATDRARKRDVCDGWINWAIWNSCVSCRIELLSLVPRLVAAVALTFLHGSRGDGQDHWFMHECTGGRVPGTRPGYSSGRTVVGVVRPGSARVFCWPLLRGRYGFDGSDQSRDGRPAPIISADWCSCGQADRWKRKPISVVALSWRALIWTSCIR